MLFWNSHVDEKAKKAPTCAIPPLMKGLAHFIHARSSIRAVFKLQVPTEDAL